MMEHTGKRPGDTVKLVLRKKDGREKTVERAPMNRENRQKAYRARYARMGQSRSGKFSENDSIQIRDLIKEFVRAATANDREAVAKTLSLHATDGTKDQHYLDDAKKLLELAPKLAEIRSLTSLGNNKAMAVTDFLNAEPLAGLKRWPMMCIVYHCVRENDRWLIQDLDGEDVDGLVREVGRGVSRRGPDTQHDQRGKANRLANCAA